MTVAELEIYLTIRANPRRTLSGDFELTRLWMARTEKRMQKVDRRMLVLMLAQVHGEPLPERARRKLRRWENRYMLETRRHSG